MPDWDSIINSVYKAPGLTYLNAGSISITPKVVFEKCNKLRERLHANPVDYVWRWAQPEVMIVQRLPDTFASDKIFVLSDRKLPISRIWVLGWLFAMIQPSYLSPQ